MAWKPFPGRAARPPGGKPVFLPNLERLEDRTNPSDLGDFIRQSEMRQLVEQYRQALDQLPKQEAAQIQQFEGFILQNKELLQQQIQSIQQRLQDIQDFKKENQILTPQQLQQLNLYEQGLDGQASVAIYMADANDLFARQAEVAYIQGYAQEEQILLAGENAAIEQLVQAGYGVLDLASQYAPFDPEAEQAYTEAAWDGFQYADQSTADFWSDVGQWQAQSYGLDQVVYASNVDTPLAELQGQPGVDLSAYDACLAGTGTCFLGATG